eukprot:CAMPEP_0113463068 /NCGR_PEP_ID=MMETSP0014_2-20120614/12445_1 /TAXON_ID=2857 /ORGANISM="Nitzschia sp." /LENGTH=175 /DNA_ID=CAMNT_0000355007 /DNA_START=623 /DNA_END=1150 /DNA_ORIENTATION=+ /assembly_acc=CAM_ASM_000159
MKLVSAAISLLVVTAAAMMTSTTVVDASSDTDGELTVSRTCKGEHLELNCEWEGNNRRRGRSLLRTAAAAAAPGKAMTTVELPNHRKLDLELDDVKCTATFGHFDHYFVELHFPDEFVVEIREADGVDDIGVFTAEVKLDGDGDAPDIVGAIEVELVDTDYGAVYDGSSIGVECP